MKVEIGQRIKSLRIEKGVTQEELANHLGLSYQAVSKWENNISTPDIQFLPLLSVYFGVTIDDLFEMPHEVHLDRIDQMIDNERIMSTENFNYAEQYLKGILDEDPKCARAYYLLAALHYHRAESDKYLASEYAKSALFYAPDDKAHHNIFNKAMGGVASDDYYNRHDALIDYYENFVKTHPTNRRAYLYLLDQLIADRHFERAKEVLEQVKTLKHTCLDTIYEGDIAFAKGNEEEALTLWNASVTEFPNAWEAYISRGDGFVKLGRYEEAISDYEKCFSLMEKPRYTDPLTFMAKAYELNGDYAKAIETHQRVIKILEQDYNIVSGELVDAPMREIKRLQALI